MAVCVGLRAVPFETIDDTAAKSDPLNGWAPAR